MTERRAQAEVSVIDFRSGEIPAETGCPLRSDIVPALSSDEWAWRTDLAARQADAAGFHATAEAFRAISNDKTDTL